MNLVIKSFCLLSISLLLAACYPPAYKPAQNGYNQQKVVYHVSDISNARRALINIKNHLNALGDNNADIILVANGSGVQALVTGAEDEKSRSYDTYANELVSRGVAFQVCDTALRAKKIDRQELLTGVDVVPSGVAQLVHLQQQGYYYIRP